MAFSRTRTVEKMAFQLLLAAILVFPSRGAIFWQSFPSLENKNFLSDGSWMPDGFTFCLGSFEAGFEPATENAADWHSHWNTAGFAVFSKARFNAFSQLTSVGGDSNFTAGEQAYVWGYNTSGEWILLKNPAWIWPAAQQPEPSISWSTDQGTTAMVGQIGFGSDQFHLKTERIGSSPEVPFLKKSEWQSTYFSPAQLADSTISGWQSDPDGDGFINLMEFALGTMPLSGDRSAPVHRAKVEEVDGERYLALELGKPPHADITYTVQVSSDLVHWDSGESHTVTIVDTGGVLKVRDSLSISSNPRRYIRFTVHLN